MSPTASERQGEIIRVGQLEIRYLQEASGENQLGCFELRVPPGSNVPPPHSHSTNEELVYVLEGTLRYSVGAETRDLRAGESWVTPRGVPHGFGNPHAVTARALVILSPDTIGPQYFRDIAAIVNAGGPPDKLKVAGIMREYGLSLAPAGPA